MFLETLLTLAGVIVAFTGGALLVLYNVASPMYVSLAVAAGLVLLLALLPILTCSRRRHAYEEQMSINPYTGSLTYPGDIIIPSSTIQFQ